MQTDPTSAIPSGMEPITIDLDPTPDVIERFEEWIAEQVREIEAAGIIVLSVEGCTIHGYYHPETVDRDFLES